jgi:hypothetical protein
MLVRLSPMSGVLAMRVLSAADRGCLLVVLLLQAAGHKAQGPDPGLRTCQRGAGVPLMAMTPAGSAHAV